FGVVVGAMGQFIKFVDEAVSLPQNFRGVLQIAWSGATPGYAVGLLLYPNGTLAAVPVVPVGNSSASVTEVFPHTADGVIPGFAYVGQIVLVNGDSRDIQVSVETFGDNGAPLSFNFEVVGVAPPDPGSVVLLTVPANSMRVLR